MNDVMLESLFFGVLVSCVTYELGGWLRKKTKISLINPLLFSIIAVIAVLLACNIDYDTYYNGAKGEDGRRCLLPVLIPILSDI